MSEKERKMNQEIKIDSIKLEIRDLVFKYCIYHNTNCNPYLQMEFRIKL